jgi:hypothetical protein
MKIIIITVLTVTTFVTSNSYGQSFKDKLKAKAAAAKATSSSPASGSPSLASAKSSATKYTILEAERSPAGGTTKTLLIEEGENNGKQLMIIKACASGCTPAMYTFQDELSKTLGKKIYFTTAGLYVMEYDENSFVSIMPDKQLGKAPFGKIMFSNFYSKDASKVNTMTKAKAEAYAIDLSNKILAPSSTESSKGGNGTYSAATAVKFSGNAYEELDIIFEEGAMKKIVTKLMKGDKAASTDTYMFMEEYSKLIGVDIYANSISHLNQYIYVDKPGVLIWARYKNGGLGNQLWEQYDYYNMFAMDKQVVRGLLNSQDEQKALDVKVAGWTKTIKEVEDKKRVDNKQQQIENQKLPIEGLVDAKLKEQTLAAAKTWAASYKWKETITGAYFTGNDWSIVRHSLTGIQLRREIRGVIVMKRPDGGCSFHYALFAQEYDGANYLSVYTAGITPGQIQLKCENAQ